MKLLLCVPKNPVEMDDGFTLIHNQLIKALSLKNEIWIYIESWNKEDEDIVKRHHPNVFLTNPLLSNSPSKEYHPSLSLLDRRFLPSHPQTVNHIQNINWAHKNHQFDGIIGFHLEAASYLQSIDNTVTMNHVVDDPMGPYLQQNYSFWRKLSHWKEIIKVYYHSRRFSPKVDMLLTVTNEDSSSLKAYSKHKKIQTLPNGVDIKFFSPGTEGKAPIVIFTGKMDFFANVAAVIYFAQNIWPIVLKKHPRAEFWIVGRKPTMQVRELEEEYPQIKVTGEVPDLRTYIADAWVAIAPMVVGSGIKNKVLEAWAMEKPVVSTSLGSRGLKYTHGENMFVTNDPADYAECISNLIKNQALRKQIGQAARKTVLQGYTWEARAEQLMNYIAKAK